MKPVYMKIYSTIVTVLLVSYSFAQPTFIGTTHFGGQEGLGTMFKTDINGNNYQTFFHGTGMGSSPYGALVEVSNGIFYGVATEYESDSKGLIFAYDAVNDVYTEKYRFDGTNGAYPFSGLTLASNGKLYGITAQGGANGNGVLFEYDYVNDIYTKKKDLDVAGTGVSPYGELYEASNGLLYGLNSYGGVNNNGTLIEYDPVNDVLTKKIDFNAATTGNGHGGSLVEQNGKLYGITTDGGTNNGGVLFEYVLATGAITPLFNFTQASTYGTPVIASNGKLYGVTRQSGTNFSGEIFEYDFSTTTLTFKGSLDQIGFSDGIGRLTEAASGKLYGICYGGGANHRGGIFEYDINSDALTKKFDLSMEDGIDPEISSFILGSDGSLYGVMPGGGSTGYGVLYKFDPAASVYTVFVNFNVSIEGFRPRFLFTSSSGKIYGLSYAGGLYYGGTLFEFDPVTLTTTTLANFEQTQTGSGPYMMMEASNGKFYGRTYRGGTNDRGVLFEFDPTDNTLSKKVDLTITTGGLDGGLLEVSGKLYGVGRFGGTAFAGTLFSYDVTTSSLTVLANMNPSGISTPFGNLVQASNGKLYGTSSFGGSSALGTIFEYDISTNVLAKKIDLSAALGSRPYGGMKEGAANKLYGLTSTGGANDDGVVFEYDASTNSYTVLEDFDASTAGELPTGEFMKAMNGKLYAMTTAGGSNSFGALVEFNPTTNQIVKKYDFPEKAHGLLEPGFLVELCTKPRYEAVTAIEQCNSTQLTLEVTSANTDTYVWKKDGSVLTGQTSGTVSISNAQGGDSGQYTAELTNLCGTSVVTIDVSISDMFITLNKTDLICNGEPDGVIEAEVSGGITPYQYSIDGVNFQTSEVFPDLLAGSYTVTVKDAMGCTRTANQTLSEPSAIEAVIDNTDLPCPGGQSGSISITARNGTGALDYSIDGTNFQASPDFTGLDGGSYTVVVRDVNGCTLTETIDISEPNALVLSASFTGTEVIVTATGGTSPYSFSANGTDFQTDNSFALANGEYTFYVKDANNCEATTTQLLLITALETSPERPSVLAYPNPVLSTLYVDGLSEHSTIRLLDVSGKLVYETTATGKQSEISVRSLNPGFYVMEAINADQNRVKLRVVKE